MTFDSIITFLALLIAFFAFIPRYRRLEISLRFNVLDWVIIVIAFLSLNYLQFYGFFVRIGLSPQLGLHRWAITPANASYVVVVLAVIIITIHLSLFRLRRNSVPKFSRLIEELLFSRRYNEILSLLERHFQTLLKIVNYKPKIVVLRERISRKLNEEVILRNLSTKMNVQLSQKKSTVFTYSHRTFLKIIYNILPEYDMKVEVARDIERELLLNRDFVSALTVFRPYLAMEIVKQDFTDMFDFFFLYLYWMIHNTESVLYYEIKNNQNISSDHR